MSHLNFRRSYLRHLYIPISMLCLAVIIAAIYMDWFEYSTDTACSAYKLENEFLHEEKEALKKALDEKLGAMESLSEMEKVKHILSFMGDFVLIEPNYYDPTKERFRAYQIYRCMKKNVGQLCSGLADLFVGCLNVYGIECRRIRGHNISSSHVLFDKFIKHYKWNGHSTVEVKVAGKWILADPTFFMLLKLNGEYISIEQGINALLKDRNIKFEYEYISDRYRADRYYGGKTSNYWRDLFFSNVIVYEPFDRYPYHDVYSTTITLGNLKQQRSPKFYVGDIIVEQITPFRDYVWDDLKRD